MTASAFDRGLPPQAIRTHPLIKARHLALIVIIYLRQSSPGQVRDNWGSTTLQQELEKLALEYGWRPDQIRVIDEDLGRSGSTTAGRTGWERMLHMVGTGTVGAVIALNVSRLARQVANFEELRILAKYNDTMLILDGRVIDPADANDTALAQVQAVFAQLDNHGRTKHLRDTKLAKARSGATVSRLPIGWLKNPNRTFDFDPEVKPAIDEVYEVFRRVRTLRGTVSELNRLGRKLPTRRKSLEWKKPSIEVVGRFIRNPAYSGTYLYGKSDHRPEYGLDSKDRPVRRRLPESEWIRHEHHHPAYITHEEQREFLRQLEKNSFNARDRPSHGEALGQGLLVCGVCGFGLAVQYPGRGSRRYQCTTRSAQYAEKPCFSITGEKLDAAIERLFLERLGDPLSEVCKDALREAQEAERTGLARIETERQRLQHAERIAQERYEEVDARNRPVAARLEKAWNDAIVALEDFERRVAEQPRPRSMDDIADELLRLEREIGDLPSLWRHSLLTDRERKEMLHCLIDQIVVNRTAFAIEATVHWVDGTDSPIRLLHLGGIRDWVRQLHAEGLMAKQIRECLAAGHPETGQRFSYTVTHIYQILKVLRVAPNSPRTRLTRLREEIDELYGRGLSAREVADRLNAAGHLTSRGKPWTRGTVDHWMTVRNRRRHLKDLHHRLLTEARRRGLSAAQTAEEFNRRGVPRPGDREWTADSVRQRKAYLRRRVRIAH